MQQFSTAYKQAKKEAAKKSNKNKLNTKQITPKQSLGVKGLV